MDAVLLLNADYTPLRVLPWERAVTMLLDEKVDLVVGYADRLVRSASLRLPWPAVVALRRYRRGGTGVPFNRAMVLARDKATCQYCGHAPRRPGGQPDLSALTMDHVVPRAQAREGVVRLPWSGRRVPLTCWENVVTACAPCNRAKGARTPEEAGLTLRALPRRPGPRELLEARIARVTAPPEWMDFLPSAAGDQPSSQYQSVV